MRIIMTDWVCVKMTVLIGADVCRGDVVLRRCVGWRVLHAVQLLSPEGQTEF